MDNKNMYYTGDHEWVKVEGENAYIGITDYAQKALGDIVYVELPDVDITLDSQESFGVVESVKAAVDIYMPISGTVLEVNDALADSPELVNEDAYKNWIINIKISDDSELGKLMNEEKYKAFCNKGDEHE